MQGRPPALLERDGQLRELEGFLDALRRGVPHDLSVTGPAGTGKTRLLDHAQQGAGDMTVVRATGVPLERTFAWAGITQLFARVIRDGDGGDLLVGAAAALRGLLLGEGQPQGPGAAFAISHGLHWLTVSLTEDRRPLLIIVDDAQWLDEETLRALRYVQRRRDETTTGLLLAIRPTVGDRGGAVSPALAELTADPSCRQVQVDALSQDATLALITSQAPGASPAFQDAVAAASGGNPLLCVELIAAARATGVTAAEPPASWLTELSSTTLATTIRRQLGALGTDVDAVATAAAVLGVDVGVAALAAATQQPPRHVAGAVERLLAAGFLTEDPDLRFTHPLVRQVLAADASRTCRRRYHRAAAITLHELRRPSRQVGAHLLDAGDLSDLPWAVAQLVDSASTHAARGDHLAAVAHLRAARRHAADHDVRVAVLTQLAASQLALRDASVTETLDAAIAELPGAADPVAAHRLGDVLYGSAHYDAATLAFERATALSVSDGPDALAAESIVRELTSARMAGRSAERVRGMLDAVAADPPARPTLADRVLLSGAAGDYALSGDRPAATVLALLEAADPHGLTQIVPPVVLQPALGAYLATDHFDQSLAFLDDLVPGDRADPTVRVGLMATRSYTLFCRGHVGQAVEEAEWVLEVQQELDLPERVLAVPRQTLALAALLDDDRDRALRVTAVQDPDTVMAGSPFLGAFLDARGRAHLSSGEHEQAASCFRRAGQVFARSGGEGGTLYAWRSGLGQALVAGGQVAEGSSLVAEELRRARTFGAPRHVARALRTAATLVVDPGARISHLDEAVAVLEGSQARTERVECLLALGGALRRSGRRRDCRPVLREGLDLARSLHLVTAARWAVDELEASGATRPDLPRSGRASLTPSELRVARLVADGASNREAAEILVLSRRTVEVHLSNIYRKLGIARRGELATAL